VSTELNDTIKELIIRYLAGETSPEEERKLLSWVDESTANKKQFDQFKKALKWSDEHYASAANLKIDLDKEWAHFVRQVDKHGETPVVLLQPGRQAAVWYRIAAVFLGLLVVGYIINLLVSKPGDFYFETAENTLTVDLPDGSHVILNRYSSVSYNDDFGNQNRSLQLKGEAFFEVTPDKQKPFVIGVKDGKIEVVGTSFNVRAYDSLAETEVIVESGMVKFSSGNVKNELMLSAGQKGTFTREKNTLIVAENKDVNFRSWQTRKITFDNTGMIEVAETLRKTYGVEIVMPAVIPPSCSVTASFDNDPLDVVLNVLDGFLDLTYKIDGNRVEIISFGC
jgi:transmembrane sensor